MKRMTILVAMAATGLSFSAWAQAPAPSETAPNMPSPNAVPAEKVDPKDPLSTGSTQDLSDKLQQNDGVIKPPATGTPDMRVPAPVPNPGTTPVIPAPGSPGGNQTVDPK